MQNKELNLRGFRTSTASPAENPPPVGSMLHRFKAYVNIWWHVSVAKYCLLQGIVSKGKESYRRRSSLLPEEVRDSEARLAASMELYSQRCDNLGVSTS
jgi:hypothetical protein